MTDQFCVVLPLFYANVCSVAIFTPFIEEFAKSYPLLYRHGETERSIFTLGFLTGTGFGISEFLVYVIVLGAPIPIRILAALFHAASTAVIAYGIAKNRTVRFYFVSVLLHSLNNLSALLGQTWFLVGAIALSLTYNLCFILYRKTSESIISGSQIDR